MSSTEERVAQQEAFASYIDEYVVYLRDVRKLSPNTVRAYATDLDAFLGWVKREGVLPLEVSHRQLRRWLMDLNRAAYTPKTVNRKLSAVRSLYRWLVHTDRTSMDSAAALASPKLAKLLPHSMSDSEVGRLIDTCDPSTVEGLRDRALIELLYATGARISEAAGLTLADIDLAQGQVRLFGKGSKERIVPIHRTCADTVRAYLLRSRPELLAAAKDRTGTDTLFISTRGNPMKAAALRTVFERHVAQAGLDASITPHAMRHSYATELLGGGADLRSVQELLGHESLSTTQIYTHLSIDRLKQATRQAHPRSGE
ncbi:MAG: tyrosine recombinase XerC [Atopobiaceae bacterium]|nr:tyrosine recombinase XerC [Atopobiaceae bacterium]